MSPTVSVIVPLYQCVGTVRETLHSLVNQTCSDWEAIIVNDGSTDRGPELAREYAKADPRFRVLDQSNRGLAGARNTGLDQAKGKYVYFLDADDWVEPNGLADLVSVAQTNGGAACGAYACRDTAGNSLGVSKWPAVPSIGLNELIAHNQFASHAHLVERSMIGAERFDESLCVVEDHDMWIRLAERGVRWTSVESVVAAYRVRAASLSKDFEKMHLTACRVVRSAFERARSAHGPGVDCGVERMNRALRDLSLEYWTLLTLTGKIPAASILDGLRSASAPIGEMQAAACAYWSLLLGQGVRPTAREVRAPLWVARLEEGWHSLEATGLARSDFVEKAMDALGLAFVGPDRVASEIVRRCGNSAMVVVGLGQNGRALLRETRRVGLAVEIRDDRDELARELARGSGGAMSSRTINSEVRPDGVVVLTPEDSWGLTSRFSGPRVVRWSDVRNALADSERDAIHAARHASPARSGLPSL